MAEALHLKSDELSELASIEDFVAAVREGYRQRGLGAPARPRTALTNQDPGGMITSYIAILPETGAMGGYTYSAGFREQDAWFMTPVFDADSGEPLALLDGAWMNPFKTGAAGGVGIDSLARQDAETVGIIGSGAQARGQLLAANAVRDLSEVFVYSPTEKNRDAFAATFNDRFEVTVSSVSSSEDAITDADIVITATTSSNPVFDGSKLAPGTHVTAMGQYHPKKRELDTTTIRSSTYVPDLRDRVLQDAGSFLYALEKGVVTEDHVHAELGEIVAGQQPGRTTDDEITVFDSGGTAVETVASAYMLYEKAREQGVGTPIDFSPASDAMPGK